jgi:acetylornithine/N-succinyldiaminopimelate aminotransferase
MVGIELAKPGRPVADACREQGLLVNCTQGTVIRLLPAMTITKAQLERAIGIFERVLRTEAGG